jgi:hypothetical protein
MKLRLLVPVLLVCSTAMAGKKSSDSFTGYAGLKMRGIPAPKSKPFAKAWALADHDNTTNRYASKKKTAPAFMGVKVDEAVLTVSKKLKFVVGFSLKLSGDHCAALEKAISKAWGEEQQIGGMNKEVEWPGSKISASMEHQGLDCIVSIGDKQWDDVKDELKKP